MAKKIVKQSERVRRGKMATVTWIVIYLNLFLAFSFALVNTLWIILDPENTWEHCKATLLPILGAGGLVNLVWLSVTIYYHKDIYAYWKSLDHYYSLIQQYTTLKDEYKTLRDDTKLVIIEYNSFRDHYDNLKTQHDSLKAQDHRCKSENNPFKTQCTNLKALYDIHKAKYETMENQRQITNYQCQSLSDLRKPIKDLKEILNMEWNKLWGQYTTPQIKYGTFDNVVSV